MMDFSQKVKDYEFLFKDLVSQNDVALKTEFFVESLKDWSELDSIETIKDWFLKKQKEISNQVTIEEIPINECKNWTSVEGKITHDSGGFYEIVGVRVGQTSDREVKNGWDQPFIKQVGLNGGILGLIRTKINNIPYYVCDAKFEPGNPDIIQISPTLQATFSNLQKIHGGSSPNFSEFFYPQADDDATTLLDQWFSEDGGRLYLKRNKGIVLSLPFEKIESKLSDRYKLLTLFQIKELIKLNSWVSPHLRSLISWI
jgi:dTDP-4-dehydro-6-deoxy-alpha-D-glucopyranose 2,3-dehydratase